MSNVFQPSLEQRKNTQSIAMIVVLVSIGMLFASLFLGYTVLRFSQETWPPQSFEKISLLFPTISTIVIVLSSFSFEFMKRSYQEINKNKFMLLWLLTFNFGLAFFVSQMLLWKDLNASGLIPSSGTFASIIHGFTWIHAAHMAIAIFALFYLSKLFKKDIKDEYFHWFSNVEKLWHFLGVIWLIMFIFLFLI